MRRIGGGIALAAGILGLFAPFLDGFFALVAADGGTPLEANAFAICIGAGSALAVMVLGALIISRSSRLFGVLLIGLCLVAVIATLGTLSRILLSIALLGGALSLIGGRTASEW